MAATVKTAWSKPGAWALDAEENESELLQQQKEATAAAAAAATNGHTETPDFPSLAAAKTKKKKKQTLSLHEFSNYSAPKPAAYQAKGLTSDELMSLPTGPRERSAEELDRSKGFRSYGVGMRDEQPRRQGSFNRESNRDMAPSRADETDNWATGKRSPVANGFERRERGERGAFFTDSQSRADEVDNWASNKSFAPSEPRRYERRGSFGLESSNGADSGSWMKSKEEAPRMGSAFDSLRERRGGSESNGADADSWGRRREDGNVGSRPRLNLQPRTLPVVAIEVQKPEPVAEEKPKVEIVAAVKPRASNPFGEARPREEVLKEKGQDWKEIEEKLESTKIKDVVSDGPDPAKRNFWSGRERRQEEKTERAWRKPGSADSRPQSAGGSVNGNSVKSENGHAEEAEGVEA